MDVTVIAFHLPYPELQARTLHFLESAISIRYGGLIVVDCFSKKSSTILKRTKYLFLYNFIIYFYTIIYFIECY